MSIELISDIKQANGGQFPLVDSNDIKGGLYSVDTESEMNSIPVVRLKDGMLCWIKDLKKYMRYDLAENLWVDPKFGTDSSSSSIDVVDNLTTISSSSALSANQGYQLNTYKFDDVSLSGYTLSFIANNTVRRFVQLPQYTLPIASDSQLGGVMIGEGLSISDGKINVLNNDVTWDDIQNKPTIPTKVSQLQNDSGYLTSENLPDEYILPSATSSSLGGVIVGDGLSVNSNGVISSNHIDDIINNLKLSYDSSTGTVNLTYNNNIISSITIEVSKNNYSIINNLNNATTNNVSGSIEEGSSYSATITANTGYTISSITVTMNGEDVTSSAVSGNNINISNVTGNIIITVNTSVTTYTITNNLTNCTTNNNSNTISYNSSYSSVISANSGYEISSITVTMGGADITSSAVNGNNINISNVTGNIVITVNTTMIVITMYNITRNLSNCTIDNSLSTIESGSNYIATITVDSGYTNLSITVIMGETDITSSVVRGNIINIPSVTGNIVITARATQSSTEVVIDESLEILTSFNYINMTEGGYKVLYVKLSKQPTSNVIVNISSSSSDLSLSKSSLTFTNTNWYTSQSINIISSNDTNTIDETYQLTLSSSGLANKVVTIDVVDESNSGFEVLYNNGKLISGASLSLNNATDNGTYITTNMNADESIIISGYKLNLNKNDKVHLLVGLATTDPSGIYSIRSMQLGDSSANDISGSNMISEEAISKNLVNGKVDTYWTVASSLSNIELTFTGYFARVNIYKIYIERGN